MAGAGGGSQAGDCCSGAEAGFVAGADSGVWSAPVFSPAPYQILE